MEGFCVIGLELEDAIEDGYGFLILSKECIGDGKSMECLGIIGVEVDGFLEVLGSLLDF